MAKAIVLGVNGQDGSYLADSLLERGHDVIGLGRDTNSRHVEPQNGFVYISLDVSKSADLMAVLTQFEPDIAFHFAALHGAIGDGFSYEADWREMMQVNVFALHVLLEYARRSRPSMRVIYAGSAKILANPLSGHIDEHSTMKASCLYGIGKLTARDLMLRYRADHSISCTNLILFNHDSPRRPRQFFLPRLATAISAAQRNKSFQTNIRTLDFRIDWSAADEIMSMIVEIFEHQDFDELVIASGKTIYARAFVEEVFQSFGLNASDHLTENLPRAFPGPTFTVNIDRFAGACGRRPNKAAFDIIVDILQSQRP